MFFNAQQYTSKTLLEATVFRSKITMIIVHQQPKLESMLILPKGAQTLLYTTLSVLVDTS